MKAAKTISEQIDFLKSKKLIFGNEVEASEFILQNNYYRLAEYWRKYQINSDKGKNNFVDNTTFEKIVDIYELDILLRNLLQKGIGIFEVCFRSKFAYYMAQSEPNGQFLYLQQNSYNDKVSKDEQPEDLLIKINNEIVRAISKRVISFGMETRKGNFSNIGSWLERANYKFVRHYQKTDEDISVLMAIEMLSFNTVSRMYSRWTNREINKKISSDFNLFKDYGCSIQVVRSLVILRNMCAHYERIWNRRLVIDKVIDKEYLQKFGSSSKMSQWRPISVLMSLVDEINKNKKFSQDVLNLCKQNKEFYKGLVEPTL